MRRERRRRKRKRTGLSHLEIEPVAVDRVHTQATQRTQYTARAALGHTLTGIHARDRLTHEGKGEQVFVVGWEGEADLLNPRNWSISKRVGVTLQIAAIAFAVCAASSIDAAIVPQAAAEFGVSEIAETLATGTWSAQRALQQHQKQQKPT